MLLSFAIVTNPETDMCSSAEDFSSALEDTLSEEPPTNCLKPAALPLVEMARLEMEILANLFKLQCQLSNLEFLNSILSLRFVALKLDKYCARSNMVS